MMREVLVVLMNLDYYRHVCETIKAIFHRFPSLFLLFNYCKLKQKGV